MGQFKTAEEELIPIVLKILNGEYDQDSLPSVELLDQIPTRNSIPENSAEELGSILNERLAHYGIDACVAGYESGPVITRFALNLSSDSSFYAISRIADVLARDLKVRSIRVIDLSPETSCAGIEIPNIHRRTVYFREIVSSDVCRSSGGKLSCVLGCTMLGRPVVFDLTEIRHLLLAGKTGSGKTTGIHSMILSLLYKYTPDDLRLILIDPVMLDFSHYDGIPHLLTPVVTDMRDATDALSWCVREMKRRERVMKNLDVRNISEYNEKVMKAVADGNPIRDPVWERTDSRPYLGKLPSVVVVIGELADLLMQMGKSQERLIKQLAAGAADAGIHMIISTASARGDVLTHKIKKHISSRLSYTVSNKNESQMIIDQNGAESLLGMGDMLFQPAGPDSLFRMHGAYVSKSEVERVADYWKTQGSPRYVDILPSEDRRQPESDDCENKVLSTPVFFDCHRNFDR